MIVERSKVIYDLKIDLVDQSVMQSNACFSLNDALSLINSALNSRLARGDRPTCCNDLSATGFK